MGKQEIISNGKNAVSSTNDVRKTGQQHAKELNWSTFTHTKNRFKMDERPQYDPGNHQNPREEQRQ